jgi:hypothetical protein
LRENCCERAKIAKLTPSGPRHHFHRSRLVMKPVGNHQLCPRPLLQRHDFLGIGKTGRSGLFQKNMNTSFQSGSYKIGMQRVWRRNINRIYLARAKKLAVLVIRPGLDLVFSSQPLRFYRIASYQCGELGIVRAPDPGHESLLGYLPAPDDGVPHLFLAREHAELLC